MPRSASLIPRHRLRWIPAHLRLAHEYSFFLQDEATRILVEYELAKAHHVTFIFRNKAEAARYQEIAAREDPVSAMRAIGYDAEARRVILNQTIFAMVSDCQHHIYEALKCLEKRKLIVALNLLRKPLTDNLLYFSWMLGDEDGFYRAFTTNSPRGITASILKGRRAELIAGALAKTEVAPVLNAEFIDRTLFERANASGFQQLFQHAVHLITVQHVELATRAENFNFIFKNPSDDDLYEVVYDVLPHIMLYLSHVIMELFERIKPIDMGAKKAFNERSILGLYLVEGDENEAFALDHLSSFETLRCPDCNAALKLTPHVAARIVLSESYRCSGCRRVHAFPFSWIF